VTGASGRHEPALGAAREPGLLGSMARDRASIIRDNLRFGYHAGAACTNDDVTECACGTGETATCPDKACVCLPGAPLVMLLLSVMFLMSVIRGSHADKDCSDHAEICMSLGGCDCCCSKDTCQQIGQGPLMHRLYGHTELRRPPGCCVSVQECASCEVSIQDGLASRP
jgi:hypothetical protein